MDDYGATDKDVEASAPPPSYDSLYGKIKQANAESTSPVEYCQKSASALQGACGCCAALIGIILCCGLGLALPIAEIVIGSMHVHDCPINYLIPIYLIVGGVFSFFAGGGCCGGNGSSMTSGLRRNDDAVQEEEKDGKKKASSGCGGIISFFLFVWLICGTVWTVSTHDHYSPNKYTNDTTTGELVLNSLYCDETVFKFAYWLSIVKWIFAGVVIVGACLVGCCLCCVRCFTSK